eukprot:TRINITY_DN438_c0_g2_i3.p1 TRINITY_DN438_c0_g2~~TRINITY_DN438_c0_g2_i3.p1  ORF type:complete len:330 (-),score=87.83 TRINITY_DN438_c0_g2_i3:36-1025(-)
MCIRDRYQRRVRGNSDEEEDEDEEDEYDTRTEKIDGKRPLFIIRAVDRYGNDEQNPLVNDDKPLSLSVRQTLALCWAYEDVQKYYKDEEDTRVDIDESANDNVEKEPAEKISLETCLDMFTKEETLGAEDPWYCNKCKKHQQATKQFHLWKLPKILIVHLKRFSYRNRYARDKLECFVDYPLTNFDIGKYVLGEQSTTLYDLYAVSNHYGSLGGGHYTAYGFNHRENKWYKYDDSSVSEVPAESVRTSAAYVLFYKRRDCDPNVWKAESHAEAKPDKESSEDESEDGNSDDGNDDGESDDEGDEGDDGDVEAGEDGETEVAEETVDGVD